jgi:hypothetical protein
MGWKKRNAATLGWMAGALLRVLFIFSSLTTSECLLNFISEIQTSPPHFQPLCESAQAKRLSMVYSISFLIRLLTGRNK